MTVYKELVPPQFFFFQMISPSMRLNVVLDFICIGSVNLPEAWVFGRVLHVESKHRTCASFCYLSNIDIIQWLTQYSTCTRQNTLYLIIPEIIPVYKLVLELYLCLNVNFNGKFSIRPGSSVVKRLATHFKVVGLNPTAGKIFVFLALLTVRLSPYK